MLERIHWLGHASFRINGGIGEDGCVIYIDPWMLPPDAPPADLILISHDHHDHCSRQDIEQVQTGETVIIGNQRVAEIIGQGVQTLRPYQGAIIVGDVCVRAVPAYTLRHAYHAPSYGGLGFLISMMRHDVYYAGDTDLIPEMEQIGCDIAILPVGGSFTMNWEDAVKSVEILRPSYAIPMHYGREIPGSKDYGKCFCINVNGGVEAVELPVENESFRVVT
jgi:L-ascorbate metabolism protein UlaG (beta-lactamase superfamily)